MSRNAKSAIIATIALIVLFALNLLLGAVRIPTKDVVEILLGNSSGHAGWEYIILQTRLPQAITEIGRAHV